MYVDIKKLDDISVNLTGFKRKEKVNMLLLIEQVYLRFINLLSFNVLKCLV